MNYKLSLAKPASPQFPDVCETTLQYQKSHMPVVDSLPIMLASIVHLPTTQRRLEDGVLVIRIQHVMIEHSPQVPC